MFVPRYIPEYSLHVPFEKINQPGFGMVCLSRWNRDVDELNNPDAACPEIETSVAGQGSVMRIHYPCFTEFYVSDRACTGTLRDLVRCIVEVASEANLASFERTPENFKVGRNGGHLRAFVDTEAICFGRRVGGETRSDIRIANGHDVFVSVQS